MRSYSSGTTSGTFPSSRRKASRLPFAASFFRRFPGCQMLRKRRCDQVIDGQALRFGNLLCLPVEIFGNIYANRYFACLNKPRNSAGVRASMPRFAAPAKSLLLYVRIVAPRCAARSRTNSSSRSARLGRIE